MLGFICLAVIGAITVAVFLIDSLWSVLELITSYLTPYFIPTEVLPLSKRFGPWAAVTGSTDGIGKEYALELARLGMNVVLISRSEDKLRTVSREIEKLHGVKTKIIVADFSKGTEIYQNIENGLKDVPLGILVNNVGVQYEYPMPLVELPVSKAWELISVNVVAVTTLTRMVLPGMLARGRGAVVNVSSGSELQPLPLMAVYAATKSYVRSLTLALRAEVSPTVTVQHVSPLFVSTKMNTFSPTLLAGNPLVPDARTYARHAVRTLGRVTATSGYWVHGVQSFFIKLAPEWVRIKVGAQMNREFREEHMRAIKRQ
ncbi:inactive hydroxysteroid dehydrogenase-like protein 1 isoform X1 [Danaus plexippus]|uniref:inactive hydroxysteroid dehydrogenase-like protein 1 isoform X1 n=1 Tax=Danaus plexippus TaxID=13037 RepID=UPI0013C3ED68|nr:inactive hydroxysteroid dehydrogenase-like protein 1 isoform X1 [Danaus plexippus]